MTDQENEETRWMTPRQIKIAVNERGLTWSYKFILKQIRQGFLPSRRPSRNVIMVKQSDFERFYSRLHDGNGGDNDGIGHVVVSAAGS